MGGLLHLVQRGGDWAGPQPAQAITASQIIFYDSTFANLVTYLRNKTTLQLRVAMAIMRSTDKQFQLNEFSLEIIYSIVYELNKFRNDGFNQSVMVKNRTSPGSLGSRQTTHAYDTSLETAVKMSAIRCTLYAIFQQTKKLSTL